MLGLKKSPTQIIGGSGTPHEQSGIARTQWTEVAPKKGLQLGRRLAFAIDDHAVQMAAVNHLGYTVKLVDVTKEYLTGDSALPEQRSTYVARLIDDYVARFGAPGSSLHLTLSGSQTAFRTVVLPELSRKELASALEFEARKRLPFPVDECEYAHRVVARSTETSARRLHVAMVAATRTMIAERLSCFDAGGHDVSHIHHTHAVVGQLLRSVDDFREDAAYTLINVDRHRTEIAFYRGAELQFFHVSSLGSSFLARRSDPTTFEYFSESLATEIQNSLDYYTGHFTMPTTQDVFIYGDLTYSDDLINQLSDRFGFGFRRFPVERLKIWPDDGAELDGTIAACLPAIAAAVCPYRLANLLPAERSHRLGRRRNERISYAAAAILALVIGALSYGAVGESGQLEERLAGINQQIAQFESSEAFKTYRAIKAEITANESFLDKTAAEPSHLAYNLKALSNLTPQNVMLQSLDFDPGLAAPNYHLHGLVKGGDVPPEITLAEFVESLEQSPFFESMVVERHVKRRVGENHQIEFVIGARGIL